MKQYENKYLRNSKCLLYLLLLLFSSILMTVSGCSLRQKQGTASEEDTIAHIKLKSCNSIYYWRTVFNPSDKELAFLKEQDIRRMYLRMFDVMQDLKKRTVPNATIKFKRRMPDNIEVVPVVFIVKDVFESSAKDSSQIKTLASQIVERVTRMCSWNGIVHWNEIQLDCDWTPNTRNAFYLLCKNVRKQLPKEKLLSSTIRLHQLNQPAPPVNCGVLMAYNTDNFRDPRTFNSILNDNTVKTYLSKAKSFDLPLDIALPIFRWNLVFDKSGKFKRIAAYTKESAYPIQTDNEEWSQTDSEKNGEIYKLEVVPYATILKTQKLIEQYLGLQKGTYSTILYHLNETNINAYTNDEIKSLYHN